MIDEIDNYGIYNIKALEIEPNNLRCLWNKIVCLVPNIWFYLRHKKIPN